MKKKIILSMLLVTSVLMLTACSKDGPKKTTVGFLKATKNLEIEKMATFLSPELIGEYKEEIEETEEGLSLEDLKKIDGFKDLETSVKKLSKQLKYKITNIEENENNAEISLELTYANASEPIMTAFSEMLGQLFGMMFLDQENDENSMYQLMMESITKNLNEYEAETETTQGTIMLTKENNKWIIVDIDTDTINALTFGLVDGIEDIWNGWNNSDEWDWEDDSDWEDDLDDWDWEDLDDLDWED